ncbi:hypothetical protein ACFX2J_033467 [Malus domestica]
MFVALKTLIFGSKSAVSVPPQRQQELRVLRAHHLLRLERGGTQAHRHLLHRHHVHHLGHRARGRGHPAHRPRQ